MENNSPQSPPDDNPFSSDTSNNDSDSDTVDTSPDDGASENPPSDESPPDSSDSTDDSDQEYEPSDPVTSSPDAQAEEQTGPRFEPTTVYETTRVGSRDRTTTRDTDLMLADEASDLSVPPLLTGRDPHDVGGADTARSVEVYGWDEHGTAYELIQAARPAYGMQAAVRPITTLDLRGYDTDAFDEKTALPILRWTSTGQPVVRYQGREQVFMGYSGDEPEFMYAQAEDQMTVAQRRTLAGYRGSVRRRQDSRMGLSDDIDSYTASSDGTTVIVDGGTATVTAPDGTVTQRDSGRLDSGGIADILRVENAAPPPPQPTPAFAAEPSPPIQDEEANAYALIDEVAGSEAAGSYDPFAGLGGDEAVDDLYSSLSAPPSDATDAMIEYDTSAGLGAGAGSDAIRDTRQAQTAEYRRRAAEIAAQRRQAVEEADRQAGSDAMIEYDTSAGLGATAGLEALQDTYQAQAAEYRTQQAEYTRAVEEADRQAGSDAMIEYDTSAGLGATAGLDALQDTYQAQAAEYRTQQAEYTRAVEEADRQAGSDAMIEYDPAAGLGATAGLDALQDTYQAQAAAYRRAIEEADRQAGSDAMIEYDPAAGLGATAGLDALQDTYQAQASAYRRAIEEADRQAGSDAMIEYDPAAGLGATAGLDALQDTYQAQAAAYAEYQRREAQRAYRPEPTRFDEQGLSVHGQEGASQSELTERADAELREIGYVPYDTHTGRVLGHDWRTADDPTGILWAPTSAIRDYEWQQGEDAERQALQDEVERQRREMGYSGPRLDFVQEAHGAELDGIAITPGMRGGEYRQAVASIAAQHRRAVHDQRVYDDWKSIVGRAGESLPSAYDRIVDPATRPRSLGDRQQRIADYLSDLSPLERERLEQRIAAEQHDSMTGRISRADWTLLPEQVPLVGTLTAASDAQSLDSPGGRYVTPAERTPLLASYAFDVAPLPVGTAGRFARPALRGSS